MLNEVEREELNALKKQIETLTTQLTTHKILITSLISELGTHKLNSASTFNHSLRNELHKIPNHSDEFHIQKELIQKLLDQTIQFTKSLSD